MRVEPVGKGELGGDVVHRVNGAHRIVGGRYPVGAEAHEEPGAMAGLAKLRRGPAPNAKARTSRSIVSHAAAEGARTRSTWSTGCGWRTRAAPLPVAVALRQSLIELSGARICAARSGDEDGAGLPVSDRTPFPAAA